MRCRCSAVNVEEADAADVVEEAGTGGAADGASDGASGGSPSGPISPFSVANIRSMNTSLSLGSRTRPLPWSKSIACIRTMVSALRFPRSLKLPSSCAPYIFSLSHTWSAFSVRSIVHLAHSVR